MVSKALRADRVITGFTDAYRVSSRATRLAKARVRYQRAAASELSMQDEGYYLSEEIAARRVKAGLWRSPAPTPP